jgi:7,8-dihydroneopterin aldolase/epimerase/oxygenase
MDIVTIKNFEVNAIIGIFEWERENRQKLCLDLEMATDISSAASSDNIEDALDYKAVTDRLRGFIEDSDFQLIETLAEKITSIVQKEFNVPWVRLHLSKPDAIADSDVGLIIERGEKL